MKPKVLKTGRDHRAALAHIKALMDQPAPDETELELWSLLVEKYEDEHFPIDPPGPTRPSATAARKRTSRPSVRSRKRGSFAPDLLGIFTGPKNLSTRKGLSR